MIGIAIDALLVIVLLKTVSDREIGFWTAAGIGLVASTVATVLAIRLMSAVGFAGIILAAPISGILLGMALVWCFGAKIKRACVVGTVFAVVHLTYVTLVTWLLRGHIPGMS
jgi:hypothetical protein